MNKDIDLELYYKSRELLERYDLVEALAFSEDISELANLYTLLDKDFEFTTFENFLDTIIEKVENETLRNIRPLLMEDIIDFDRMLTTKLSFMEKLTPEESIKAFLNFRPKYKPYYNKDGVVENYITTLDSAITQIIDQNFKA